MKKAFQISGITVGLFWLIFVLNSLFSLEWNSFGIAPRSFAGLGGIFLAPFLHGNLAHIASNSLHFFVFCSLILLFHKEKALAFFAFSWIITGLLVWVFGRNALHIGASGVLYSMAFFLVVAGFLKKKIKDILLSIVLIVTYGSLVFGVFPNQWYISWESHLAGALTGIFLAYRFYKKKKDAPLPT